MMVKAKNLTKLNGITHGFFGRRGGASEGAFSSLNVSLRNADKTTSAWNNRGRIAAKFNRSAHDLVVLRQVHGTAVITPDRKFDPYNPQSGDALMTNQAQPLLGVTTADCAPILIADAQAKIVGAAHAGWRGALEGVSESLIQRMEEQGASRRNMVAAIGPCIAQQSYEVGGEYLATFVEHNPQNRRFFAINEQTGKHHFDLPAYVQARLTDAAIDDVELIGHDTLKLEDDYFSYRRTCLAGDRHFGLQISVIGLVC